MSKDLLLDSTLGDLDITNGLLSLTETQEKTTQQKTKIYLSLFRGEYFASITDGIPWLANDNNPIQLLSKSTTNKRFIDVYIREAILEREGIVDIVRYESEFDRQTRTMSVSFIATTESGEVITVEELEINA